VRELGKDTKRKIKKFYRMEVKNMKKVVLEVFGGISLVLLLSLFSLLFAQKANAMIVGAPYPNPFNPGAGQKTTISFSVDTSQYVTVQIVNQFTAQSGTYNSYTYQNVWNSADTVYYYNEIVKAQVARIYAYANATYYVSWDGTTDKGTSPSNLCQRGKYYFKIIPESYPQYTVFTPVNITQWNADWLAYIRQARTWIGTYPYVASGANTVSRDNGRGTNCTGFVSSVFREMGYNLYYGNFPADGVNVLTTNTSWGGGPYLKYVGQETNYTPSSYTLTKQSNILVWKRKSDGVNDHVTIATYKTSANGWFIIHSSAANNGVYEEVIPSFYYQGYFYPPFVYYWIAIGSGN
jgi:hypothetical protein